MYKRQAQGLGSLNFPHNFGVCSPCNQGKAKQKPFKDVPLPRSNRIGELIHSDLAGPFKIHTMKGEKYYQTIIDDYSHFTQVFLLKHKELSLMKSNLLTLFYFLIFDI